MNVRELAHLFNEISIIQFTTNATKTKRWSKTCSVFTCFFFFVFVFIFTSHNKITNDKQIFFIIVFHCAFTIYEKRTKKEKSIISKNQNALHKIILMSNQAERYEPRMKWTNVEHDASKHFSSHFWFICEHFSYRSHSFHFCLSSFFFFFLFAFWTWTYESDVVWNVAYSFRKMMIEFMCASMQSFYRIVDVREIFVCLQISLVFSSENFSKIENWKLKIVIVHSMTISPMESLVAIFR